MTLPCYRTVHKYRGKTVTFQKPLFPGYLFLQLVPPQRQMVYQSDYVANLLDVPDQETFKRQLGDILQALETDLEVFLAPHISAGSRVRIKSGPLRGLEGCVQERAGDEPPVLMVDLNRWPVERALLDERAAGAPESQSRPARHLPHEGKDAERDDRVGDVRLGGAAGPDGGRRRDLRALARALRAAHADGRRRHAVGADRPAARRARDSGLAVGMSVARRHGWRR